MLAEIIRELTKAKESTIVTSEQILVWAKRVEAQGVQSTIIISLSKTKEFNKIKTIKGGQRHSLRKPQIFAKCPWSRVAVILVIAIHPNNAWPMGRSAT